MLISNLCSQTIPATPHHFFQPSARPAKLFSGIRGGFSDVEVADSELHPYQGLEATVEAFTTRQVSSGGGL